MDFKKQFEEGLLSKNPVLVQLLGMCSVLAITTSLFNGIGMGLSVTLILICSNVLISALRKVIPSQIRIAAYIVIIAGFVTVVDLQHNAAGLRTDQLVIKLHHSLAVEPSLYLVALYAQTQRVPLALLED